MTDATSTTRGRCIPKKNCSNTREGSVTSTATIMYLKYIDSSACSGCPIIENIVSEKKKSVEIRSADPNATAIPAQAYWPARPVSTGTEVLADVRVDHRQQAQDHRLGHERRHTGQELRGERSRAHARDHGAVDELDDRRTEHGDARRPGHVQHLEKPGARSV